MADALQSILTQAGLALAPLRAVKTGDQAAALFRKLGYEIPAGAFGTDLSAVSNGAGQLIDGVQQPPRTLHWGESTLDEMCINFLYMAL